MQFKVPQDVQREDTIIGPITLKQLIILGIGGGITYAIYTTLSALYFMEIWLPPIIVTSGLTAAFAFLKINNLPFHLYLLTLVEYVILPKKRIWTKGGGDPFISPFSRVVTKKKKTPIEKVKKMRDLEELTGVLDTYGKSKLTKKAEEERTKGIEKVIKNKK